MQRDRSEAPEQKRHFVFSHEFRVAALIVLLVLPIVSLVEFFAPSVSTLLAYREGSVLPVVTVAKPSEKRPGTLSAILVVADPQQRDTLRVPVNTKMNGRTLDRQSFAQASVAASLMQPGVLRFEHGSGNAGPSGNALRQGLVTTIAAFYAKHASGNALTNWSNEKLLKKQIAADRALNATTDPKDGTLLLNYSGERSRLNIGAALAMTHAYVDKLRQRGGDPTALNNGFAEAALTAE